MAAAASAKPGKAEKSDKVEHSNICKRIKVCAAGAQS